MTVELVIPEKTLLREINDKKFKRKDIARTYAFALRSSKIDWRKVNSAIIDRWSFSGLKYIKKLAHDIVKGRNK